MIPCRPAHTLTACRMTFGVRRRHGLSCRLVHGHQLRTLNATPTSDTKRDTSSPSFAAARSGVWCMFWCMRKCTTELVEGPCTPPPGGSEAQAPHAQAPAGSRRLPQAPAGSRRIPQAPAGWLRPRPTGPAGSKTLHFLVGSVVAEKAVVLSCGDQSRLQQL